MKDARDIRAKMFGDLDQRLAQLNAVDAGPLSLAQLFDFGSERRVFLFDFFKEERIECHEPPHTIEIGKTKPMNSQREIPVRRLFPRAGKVKICHARMVTRKLRVASVAREARNPKHEIRNNHKARN